jgi:RND family efflux transporter MFP subunit
MWAKFLIAGLGITAVTTGAYFVSDAIYPRVHIAKASSGPAVQAVYASGTVEAVYWAKVGPLVMGRIVALEVAEGRRVSQGDVLARLDDQELRARVDEIEARQMLLEAQARRVRALLATGSATQQAFDQVESELRQTTASLIATRKRLAEMTITSPLDGIVLRRDGEIGETAREGQVLFWVGQIEPLWITTDVDDDDIPLVAVGQRALVKSDAFPDRLFEGRIREITPKGDAIQRTYRLRVDIASPSELRIGMVVEVNIVVRETKDATLVPTAAIRGKQGKHVFVIDGNRATTRVVKTGVVGGRMTEILHGLSPGESVAVDPPAGLRDGMRVRFNENRLNPAAGGRG